VATPPTLVSTTQLADTTTSPKTSASITVQAGDLIEVRGRTGDSTVTIATPVTTGQTYVLQQSVLVANYSSQYLWTTVAASTGNITVQLTRSAGTTTAVSVPPQRRTSHPVRHRWRSPPPAPTPQ
jgi:hypothetical protein